jgi:hypothetical protein
VPLQAAKVIERTLAGVVPVSFLDERASQPGASAAE